MTSLSALSGSCSYCGLPLPRPLFRRHVEPQAGVDHYCCTGCRVAAAMTQESGEVGAATWTMTSLGLSVFFSMSVMVFTVAHWMYGAYDLEGGAGTPLSAAFGQLLQWLTLLFAAPVALLLGKPLVDEAVDNLKRGVLTTDVLLLTGVMASFAYSMVSVVRGSGPVYFETGCVILLAVTFGRWLTATGRLRTTAALDELEKLLPATASVRRSGVWETVPLDDVQIADELAIKAGERIPVDGCVTSGEAAIDEQVFTGESTPVTRGIGEQVYAGTLNLDGTLQLRATARAREGAFGALLDAVRAARNSRGAYQILADRVSAAFFPLIAVIAAVTLVAHGLTRSWPEGMLAALAVVLIACPCALALATPLAVWAAMGRAARQGILFRSGEALERLARVDTVRFDKTGTLTTGTPRVADVLIAEDATYREVAARSKALTVASNHVFSRAIARLLKEIPDVPDCSDVRTVSGLGLEATINREAGLTRLGRWEWLTAMGASSGPRLQEEFFRSARSALSVVAIAWRGKIRGFYLLTEDLRPDVTAALDELRRLHLDLGILTGDREGAANSLGRRLQLPVLAELSPGEKATEVVRLQAAGAVVAMVGDGINDAPALSTADVGVALGCGADVSRASADVCLLGDDLTSLVEAITLARECVRCIRGNLAWSFGYNAIGVALAASGMLHPSAAAVLMVVSSLVVLSRSMRLGGAQGNPGAIGRGGTTAGAGEGLTAASGRSSDAIVIECDPLVTGGAR